MIFQHPWYSGAALDGGDVNVVLKVGFNTPSPSRKGIRGFSISMSSEMPVGFLDFKVQRADGTAILGKVRRGKRKEIPDGNIRGTSFWLWTAGWMKK